MAKYKIGLIDDDKDELGDIRRTIKENKPNNVELSDIELMEYSLGEGSNCLTYTINEIIEDIINFKINSLIVDYNIIVKSKKIEGTEIYKKVMDVAPNFPMIILTNLVDASVAYNFVDPDKVYNKKEFFVLENEYSKKKVLNMFRNMERYIENRNALEQKRIELKEKLEKDGTNQEIIDDIIKTESELDKLYPTDQTEIEKIFDKEGIREILEILEKANKLME